MMEVVLARAALDAMARHAEASYPEECCGFLVGMAADGQRSGTRQVRATRPVRNMVSENRTHRFIIPADEVRRAEAETEGTESQIVGFYHSHPDHPAVPSEFDQENALPWYSYVVLSVARGVTGEVGVYELDPEERRFHAVGWAAETLGTAAEGRVTEGVISANYRREGGSW